MPYIIKTKKFDLFFLRLFYITLSMYAFFIEILESTFGEISFIRFASGILIRLTFLFVVLICGYNLSRGKYSLKEIMIGIFVGIPIFISYYVGRHPFALLVLFYIYASKGIDFNKVVKTVLITLIIGYAMILCARMFGIIEEFTYVAVRNNIIRNRYAFGFYYTCIGTIYYLFITILYIYIRNEKMSYIESIVIMVFNIILYILTDTKNNFNFVTLCILTFYFLKFNSNKFLDQCFRWVTVLSAIIGTIIISFLTAMYSMGNEMIINFDRLLTGRLNLTMLAIQNYGISLFGSKVNFVGGDPSRNGGFYNYVDSAYMQYLIQYGIIVFIIIIIYLTYIAYKAHKNNHTWVLFALFIINYHAVFDDRLLNITLNPFLILFLIYINNCALTRDK